MRVLHIISSMEIGGAQKLLSELLPVQKEQGLDVELLVYYQTGNKFESSIINRGIKIHSLNKTNIKALSIISCIRKYLVDYDVVHAHLFPTLYQVALANIGLNKKLIYTEHSTHNRRREKGYLKTIEKFIYRQYSTIIGISEQTSSNLRNWLGEIPAKIITVSNGIQIPMSTEQKSFKPGDPYIIMMVSRFTSAKDQETLIKAIPHIKSDSFIVKFVGDGETQARCKLLAKTLQIESKCEFLGNREDVSDLMRDADVGVQSSNWEGFGLTAVEFMSHSKPVIASDVDGLKQVVEDAGILFPKGDEKELAQSIDNLISNKDYYDMISQKCHDRAKKFDIKNMSREYYKIYN